MDGLHANFLRRRRCLNTSSDIGSSDFSQSPKLLRLKLVYLYRNGGGLLVVVVVVAKLEFLAFLSYTSSLKTFFVGFFWLQFSPPQNCKTVVDLLDPQVFSSLDSIGFCTRWVAYQQSPSLQQIVLLLSPPLQVWSLSSMPFVLKSTSLLCRSLPWKKIWNEPRNQNFESMLRVGWTGWRASNGLIIGLVDRPNLKSWRNTVKHCREMLKHCREFWNIVESFETLSRKTEKQKWNLSLAIWKRHNKVDIKKSMQHLLIISWSALYHFETPG